MRLPPDDSPEFHVARRVARAVADRGGRAFVVGGWVRDRVLGAGGKDLDVEVFGLPAEALHEVLRALGRVDAVGAHFAVWRVRGLDIDFSLPRRDRTTGPGHRAFEVTADPAMSVEEACRRRDFTINALLADPLTGEVLDPTGGLKDLAARRLRAVDPDTFGEDPLRALRAAQFAARFELEPDPALPALLRRQDLAALPAERLFGEWRKLLLRGVRPSLGLALMEAGGLLRFFPEIDALRGVPQDPFWHPEGDVFVHTGMCLDVAVELREGDAARDEALCFATLCHDFGKPATTRRKAGGWSAHGHEAAGEAPARAFLERMRAPKKLVDQVVVLVRRHLAPVRFPQQAAGPGAYRRLARELDEVGLDLLLLERLSRADQWGRTTEHARLRTCPEGDAFLETARRLEVDRAAPPDLVLGRHLLARGLPPGPHFKRLLDRCRALQLDRGWTDPDRILDAVLADEGR